MAKAQSNPVRAADSRRRRAIKGELSLLRTNYVDRLGSALHINVAVEPIIYEFMSKALLLGKLVNSGGDTITGRENAYVIEAMRAQAQYFAGFRAAVAALEHGPPYEYCSTQINIRGPLADQIVAIGKQIDPDHLHAKGLDPQPHITVKYGLTEHNVDAVRDAVDNFGPFTIRIGGASAFRKEKYDVLKLEVKSDRLHELNALIGRTIPHIETQNSYQPHVTIGYLQPGKADLYLPMDFSAEYSVDQIVYCDKDGTFSRIGLPPSHQAMEMHQRIRLELYGGALDAAFWNGWLATLPPGSEIWWRLGVAEHCRDCVELALNSPYGRNKALPTVPRGGGTKCLGNCRCRLEAKAPGFTSGLDAPLIEIVGIGAALVDAGAPAALASAELFRSAANTYATAKQIAAADGGEGLAGTIARQTEILINTLANQMGVAARFGRTVDEIQEPVFDALARGFRMVRPEQLNDELIGKEAVLLGPEYVLHQGNVTKVERARGVVWIDDREFRVASNADGVLFVRGPGAG